MHTATELPAPATLQAEGRGLLLGLEDLPLSCRVLVATAFVSVTGASVYIFWALDHVHRDYQGLIQHAREVRMELAAERAKAAAEQHSAPEVLQQLGP